MIPILFALAAAATPAHIPAQKLDEQDVVWTTPSVDAAGSMPIGNGEVVLNVWVEKSTGDLRFYIARTDALSEISRVLKLGGVRVHLSGSPFTATNFKQRVHLHDGLIEISGGGSKVELFVDSGANTIQVSGQSSAPVSVTAEVECWRNSRHTLSKSEQASAWSVHDAPFQLSEAPDRFLASDQTGITWLHRNETSVVPQVLANQSLTGAKGAFDPILHRTFGGRLSGEGFIKTGERSLRQKAPARSFRLTIPTYTAQTRSVAEWQAGLSHVGLPSLTRTVEWWHQFWNRSWVFVSGDHGNTQVPSNSFPLRRGVDSNGQNIFPGKIESWRCVAHPLSAEAIRQLANAGADLVPSELDFSKGFTLSAKITPESLGAGRIFDKLTAGSDDGFLFDIQPGGDLRLICGALTLVAKKVVRQGVAQAVAAVFDPLSGQAGLYLNGKLVAGHQPLPGSPATRGWILQRYVQACQGRGAYPIKFNGGYYTVEPTVMGRKADPDWRNWGDSHWYQNVRHMYHPMLEQGDFEMMQPFFHLYESAVPLAESRTRKYHGASGVYFPETMTDWGTYSSGDYGWDRAGKQPKDVDCQYWQWAWNQGPELVNLMLEYWQFTRDPKFLKDRLIPMAKDVLTYFDTRFRKDAEGRIVLDPTQVVETYWHGVVNDMPSTAGLNAICRKLTQLPASRVSARDRAYFSKMSLECPKVPLEERNGVQQLAPAQKYDREVFNVENGELYAVWPFRLVDMGHRGLLEQAKAAYRNRNNHLDVGWGYDGNVAALLGMTDEASRILMVKCANSHPAFRWPATWGPNFDWIPDQNHGGNLLNTTNLMLLQADTLEDGGKIRLFAAWPPNWDVDFQLHAPGNTTVHAVLQGGKLRKLEVSPELRVRDIILPGWSVGPKDAR